MMKSHLPWSQPKTLRWHTKLKYRWLSPTLFQDWRLLTCLLKQAIQPSFSHNEFCHSSIVLSRRLAITPLFSSVYFRTLLFIIPHYYCAFSICRFYFSARCTTYSGEMCVKVWNWIRTKVFLKILILLRPRQQQVLFQQICVKLCRNNQSHPLFWHPS